MTNSPGSPEAVARKVRSFVERLADLDIEDLSAQTCEDVLAGIIRDASAILATPAQPEEPSDAPCSHPSYDWSALGVTCAHCDAEGWHAAHGKIVWKKPPENLSDADQ